MKSRDSIRQENLKASPVERASAAIGICVFAIGTLAVARINPSTAGIFPACPFHSLTGLNCPGCGLTRGFHALFNGDVLTALHFNALLPAYALLLLFLLISLLMYAVRGRALSIKLLNPYFLWTFFVASLIFAVVRNLPFYPFNLLAI